MNQVLLKLYSDYQGGMQRQKAQEVLPRISPIRSTRKSYDVRKKYVLRTSSTNYSGQTDLKFEKNSRQSNGGDSPDSSTIQSSYLQFKLPQIVKKQDRKDKNKKMRVVVWGIIFINRLTHQVRANLLQRKKTTQKCCINLITSIDRMVRGYYQKLLEKQLVDYIRILEKYLEQPDFNQDKQILDNLGEIAQKLAKSTVTRQILEFLILTSTNKAFFPSDYLTVMEMCRLEFCLKYGCIINVNQEQTRMLVGVGLGVKIFCFYVLYQPWRLSMASEMVRQRWKQLTDDVNRIGSIFYCLIQDEFCLKLKETKPVSRTVLAQMGVRPIGKLDPFGSGVVESSAKHLMIGHSKRFLVFMQAKYSEKMRGIKQNIYKWISRIAYICLKQSIKFQRKGQNPIQSLRTIESREMVGRGRNISKVHEYKSVQMKAGLSLGRSVKKSYI